MTGRRMLAAGAVGVAVATVAGSALLGGDDVQEPAAASQSGATATIRQQDLVEREAVDGTLGYSDARTVINRLAGTVTWTPAAGATVRTGRRLYAVDGQPVYLLDGTFPAYRTLKAGSSGADVRQFERNMRDLGFDPYGAMTVDGTWDAGTTAAAKRWQEAHGLDEDGAVEIGRVVFQPGTRRVSEVTLAAGASASGGGGGADPAASGDDRGGDVSTELMTTTSTRRIVAVDLETTKQALARRGGAVVVELPDGRQVRGTIASVGSVARKESSEQEDDPPATIKVVIRLRNAAAAGRLDQAPVDVQFERRRAKGALTVAVTALLARSGGTYAVEVRDGGERRVVPVRTGIYTDDFVEIEGSGLRRGMTVTDSGI